MIYIKIIDKNNPLSPDGTPLNQQTTGNGYVQTNTVVIGGEVASQEMLDEGYFAYNGVVPKLTNEFQHLEFVNGALVVVEDTALKNATMKKEAKAARDLKVSQIKVTTTSGKTFNGDEVSQGRMARAIASSIAGETTTWVLADNTVATVTHNELKEALRLAGQAQTALWVV